MKTFYVEAVFNGASLNLAMRAYVLENVLQRLTDITQGMRMVGPADFDVNRISTKPSRKTTYAEI